MKLYLDPGHGGGEPGAQGNGMDEKNIVLDIALRIRNILTSDYEDVNVRMSRTGDEGVSLSQRTNEANAWGEDYFLSVHCNAFNGAASGYEDYIYSGLSDASQTAYYQDLMHAAIIDVNQLRNRGQKKANFHVLRESTMPALLTENGFIDNDGDAALLRTASWRQAVAQGHVNGLADAFNLQRKQEDDSGDIYRIIAGSFKSRDNADERVDFLYARGVNSFVDAVTVDGENWYRVQAGAFRNRENAENHLQTVRNAGVPDAYIVSEPR